MAKFLNDTLTGTDATKQQSHTGETGATWEQKLSGAFFEIKSNRIFCGGALAVSRASGVPANADYDVITILHVASVSTTAQPGPAGRVKTGTTAANCTFYGVEYYNVSNTKKWRLVKCVGSITPTVLGEFEQTLTAGDYACKLQMRGEKLKVFIAPIVEGVLGEWTQLISVTDGSITEKGSAGNWSRNTQTTTTGLHIDQIYAEDAEEEKGALPTVASQSSTVADQKATIKAKVNPKGLATTAKVEYGKTESYGTEASIGSVGEDETEHAVEKALSSLTRSTKYHYRVVATNSKGTTNGEDKTFTTPSGTSVYVGGKEIPTSLEVGNP